ncbi:MAG: T9SS type A sorting domain-containing protein [candidate division Zixibacteria bacterium]|nr:T9SS type A sorting domain-containing protein [candidate division Zixibacteria bacterium]
MDQGGAVFMEGSNVGQDHFSYMFFDYFGCEYLHPGVDYGIRQVIGVDGTFSAPNIFDFPYGSDPDWGVDELNGAEGVLYLKSQDGKGRAVYHDGGTYRTICASTILGPYVNGEGSSTKASLMGRYIDFLLGIEEPNIWYPGDEVDFGIEYTGYEDIQQISIQNHGFDLLWINGVSLVGEGFSTGCEPPYDLNTGEELLIDVAFFSEEPGDYSATLSVLSNDPDQPVAEMTLYAECLYPPDIYLSEEALAATVAPDETSTATLMIRNDGQSDLSYFLDITNPDIQVKNGKKKAQANYGTAPTSKGAIDMREGDPVGRGTGGPDSYGYRWIDSDEPNGPVFEWVEISEIGQNSGLSGDDEAVQLSLPWEFDFYGNPQTTVRVSTNGYLTFGFDGTDYVNDPIPSLATPNDLIAPFWDDLHQRSGSNYYYYDEPNRRFIIQYTNWGYYSGGGSLYFQVHLHQDGRIYYYYKTMTGTMNSATIGIENNVGDDGLQVAFNTYYMHNNLAICLTRDPLWLSIDNFTGIIPAGEYEEVNFTFDANGLEPDEFFANAILTNNDPDINEFTIPIVMNVVESAPYVSVYMVPDNAPVEVPAGGSFTFTGILTNNTEYQFRGDVWIMLDTPDGDIIGPIQQFNNIPLTAGEIASVSDVLQEVPDFAPIGDYEYIAIAGQYPSVQIDTASFEFTVTPSVGGDADAWTLSGWFDQAGADLPLKTELYASYPNPFNARTNINFDLAQAGHVELEIYNLLGQRVVSLVDKQLNAGNHTITWDASNYSSGVYLYKLRTDQYRAVKKMTLLR